MISIRNLNLRIKLKLWRFLGFASSIVGLICYALSSSFKYLIGDWTSFKFFLFAVLVLAICGTILFAKQRSLSSSGTDKLKAHLGFAVLMLTSLYSFFYDKAMNGKPDILSMVSNGSFALMSLSFSRVFLLGFEVGLFAFFLGCLAVQLMKINLMLMSVAVVYGYPLFLIHSSSDSSPDDLVDEPSGISGDNQDVVLDVDTILHEIIQESEQSRVIEGQQLRRTNVTGGATVEPGQIGLEDEFEKLRRAGEIVRLRHKGGFGSTGPIKLGVEEIVGLRQKLWGGSSTNCINAQLDYLDRSIRQRKKGRLHWHPISESVDLLLSPDEALKWGLTRGRGLGKFIYSATWPESMRPDRITCQ